MISMDGKYKKREVFYVSTELWRESLSSAGLAVYTYLSYCSNKEGESFPSLKSIGASCGISKSTVLRAISELVGLGLIEKKRRQNAASGRLSNVYRLKTGVFGRKPSGERTAKAAERAEPEGGGSSGAGGEAEENGGADDEAGLARLMFRLEPECYEPENADYAKALVIALTEMWEAGSTRINGREVPREEVRRRLNMLDSDCLDEVYAKIKARDIVNPGGYLKTCLFNAPLSVSAGTAAGRY